MLLKRDYLYPIPLCMCHHFICCILVETFVVAIIFFMYTTNNVPRLICNICFYYNLEVFRMFEILESEIENDNCEIKKIRSPPQIEKL